MRGSPEVSREDLLGILHPSWLRDFPHYCINPARTAVTAQLLYQFPHSWPRDGLSAEPGIILAAATAFNPTPSADRDGGFQIALAIFFDICYVLKKEMFFIFKVNQSQTFIMQTGTYQLNPVLPFANFKKASVAVVILAVEWLNLLLKENKI